MALHAKAIAMKRSKPACFSTLLNGTFHMPDAHQWKNKTTASGTKVDLGVDVRMKLAANSISTAKGNPTERFSPIIVAA